MFSVWTKHLKEEEKEGFQKRVLGAKKVLERLKELLSEDYQGLDRIETDSRVFDKPNWDYRQAYANGYKACLKQYIKLVDLDQQKEIQ